MILFGATHRVTEYYPLMGIQEDPTRCHELTKALQFARLPALPFQILEIFQLFWTLSAQRGAILSVKRFLIKSCPISLSHGVRRRGKTYIKGKQRENDLTAPMGRGNRVLISKPSSAFLDLKEQQQ
jgi:hypothetical protein